MKSLLFVLFFALLFTACNNKGSDKTEYYVELHGFNDGLQKCLSDKLMNKWTTFDDFSADPNKVVLYDMDNQAPKGEQVHIFRNLNSFSENQFPQQTQKIVVELDENRENFSVMIFEKEGNDWRRILNAGSFRTDLAELYAGDTTFSFANEEDRLCRFIIKIVVGLTYK